MNEGSEDGDELSDEVEELYDSFVEHSH